MAALLVGLAARHLRVTSSLDRVHVTAGEQVEETYVIEKASRAPGVSVTVQQVERAVELGLLDGRVRSQASHRRLPRRGEYEAGGGLVLVSDPFGLVEKAVGYVESQTVVVYPKPVEVAGYQSLLAPPEASQHRWQLENSEATLGDLREYQPGDPPMRIHWRTSARTGKLMVTNPETQRPAGLLLLVDLGGPPALADRAAGMATFLAEKVWQSGQEIGAIVAGRQLVQIPAGRGRDQLGRLLEPLAMVGDQPQSQVETLVRQASRCEAPGRLVLISGISRAESYVEKLRQVCRSVTVVQAADPGAG